MCSTKKHLVLNQSVKYVALIKDAGNQTEKEKVILK